MLDMRNHHFSAVADIADLDSNIDDLEWLGSNLHGLTTVVVDDVVINIEDYILDQIKNYSNPLQDSDSFGIDLYQDALSFLVNRIKTNFPNCFKN